MYHSLVMTASEIASGDGQRRDACAMKSLSSPGDLFFSYAARPGLAT